MTGASRSEYCLVDGAVASVSASAQPIRFQAALPTRWNRELLQLGDGGFRGSVTSLTANTGGTAMTPAPLVRGYVVFGSDAGHSGNPLDASFALDPEQLRNYAGEQIKKTADTIRVVVGRYYDLPAGYSYYLGASNGGREAITAIRDYPDDYEGAVSIMPGLGFTRMVLKMQLIQRAMRLDDGAGRIDGAGAEFLRRRVLEQCVGKCCGPRHVVRRRRCRRRVGRSLGGPHRHSGYTAAHPGGFAARRRGMARDDRHPAQGAQGLPLSDIEVRDPDADATRVEFGIRGVPGQPRFRGRLEGRRHQWTGSSSAARAFVSVSVATVRLPGLNHLFQTAETGLPSEYGTIEETMSPRVLDLIRDWILARTVL